MPPAAEARTDNEISSGRVVAGRYRLCEIIGEGGMGRVFRAEQAAPARSVAVKFLRPSVARDPGLVRQFVQEARAASRLRHPNAVEIFDFGVDESGEHFLVMEYVEGRNLGDIVRRQRRISIARALRLIDQLLCVLEAAHVAGVVHADIKSENLLLEKAAGAGERVKLIDFGLARLGAAGALDEVRGIVSGTPEYVAPEVIRGQIPTAAADLYAVGIVLYELLTGSTPFAGGSAVEILERQLRDAVVPPSLRQPERQIPPELERVVSRALAKDPAGRFPDARSFRSALAAVRARRARVAMSRPYPRSAAVARTTAGRDADTRSWAQRDVIPSVRRRWPRSSRPPRDPVSSGPCTRSSTGST